MADDFELSREVLLSEGIFADFGEEGILARLIESVSQDEALFRLKGLNAGAIYLVTPTAGWS